MATERQRAQRAASAQARDAAHRRLRDAHSDEYRRYYDEEAEARGVTPRSAMREKKVARLRAELERLEDDA